MHKTIIPKLHNRFDIEVTDSQIGEVRQKVTSYNIVLDTFLTRLVTKASKLGYIHLGTGEGTPAVTDTSMFIFLGARSAAVEETVKAYPTSYIRKKIVLAPSDYVGSRITEVGFGYSTSGSSAVTHSMLKDSEGNQIAIEKKDTDVVTVYATFYLTFGAATTDYVLPSPDNNAVISAVLQDTYTTLANHLGAFGDYITADEIAVKSLSSKSGITPTADTVNKKWIIPNVRWDYDKGNSHMVSAIGSPNYAVWQLPNSDIFPNISLTNIAVGTGDGTTSVFNCPIPKIVPGSESVRVNGVLMTRDVDYTIDYNNNFAEYPELFEATNPKNCTITGGNKTTSYSYYPFIVWGASKTGINSISSSKPIIFDFGTTIKVNRLYMPAGSISYGGSGSPDTAIGFDYSDDGINWINLHTTESGEHDEVSADLRLDTPIIARYWRLTSSYISNLGCGRCPNILLGYVTPGLVFTTPPAAGASIEMDCAIDRPIKNENWVLDFSFAVQFERG